MCSAARHRAARYAWEAVQTEAGRTPHVRMPFAQLMLGALCIADTDEITANLNEVADARWGCREEVADALKAVRGQCSLPRAASTATR